MPGDLLVLAEGDLIAADGELVDAAALLVDESTLTGEAVPVDKSPSAAEPDSRRVSAGTVVVRGRGQVLATHRPGQRHRPARHHARYGAADHAAAAAAAGPQPDPGCHGRGAVPGGRCPRAAPGPTLGVVVVTAISLMVAAVPESLPTVVVLSLALGASLMATHRAIVRRTPAV